MKIKPTIFQYVPAILWSAFIFVLCFLPGNDIPKYPLLEQIHFDKIVHAFLYFVLFLFIYWPIKNYNLKNIGLVLGICLLQGILIECIQGLPLVQDRSFDLLDIAANAFGSILAIFSVRRRFLKAG